jgi:hypothetical protein
VEVRALVEAALGRTLGVTLLCLLALGLGATRASAQPDDWQRSPPIYGFEDECDQTCREARARDDQVLVRLVTILDGADFRESAHAPWGVAQLERPSFGHWLERFGRWLSGTEQAPEGSHDLSQVKPVPLPLGLLLSGLSILVLLLAALALWHIRSVRSPRASTASGSAHEPPSAPTSSSQHDGSARGQLRQLYLASLTSLAQRGLLRLSSAHTNGDYLRMLGASERRAQLARLTQLFEHSQYGRTLPTERELGEAESLAAAVRSALSEPSAEARTSTPRAEPS